MTRPIRVLHLEDDPRDAEVIHHKLEGGGVRCDIVLAHSKDSFEAALARESFDLIISDYNLRGYDGTSAIKRAQEQQPDAPVIVISGSLGEEDAVKCLHIGATDYLLKQRLDRLVPAVQRAIHEAAERHSRKEAEQALLQRERRLSSIYETVSDSLFYVDVEGDGRYRITSVNQAFVSTTGLDHNQVVGKRLDEVIPEPSLTLALEKYGEAIREKKVVRWEETSEYPKGRLIGEVSIAPIFDDAGRCTHLVGAVHDVTERKQLEAQFRQSQKMEAIGQLAGGIAHDFNNLLTAILGYGELITDQIGPDKPLGQDLREIMIAAQRAAALTRQLLAFSRKQVLTVTALDLNQVVRDIEAMLRRLIGEHITITTVLAADLDAVMADATQLEQVLMNLAVNARDAMPQGGELTMRTRNAHAGAEDALHDVGLWVSLSVTDTGTGMLPEIQTKIFEPFFTTKERGHGTGLGLAAVHGIVTQLHGSITVESAVGHGTTFRIDLPATRAAVVPSMPVDTGASPVGVETILLVEDEQGVRAFITLALKRFGYQVLEADSAESALIRIEHDNQPIHLLLTDVVLPKMGGRDLAAQLSHVRPGLPVLFMSGYTEQLTTAGGFLEPGVELLEKPFTAHALLTRVRHVLNTSAS